MRIGYEAKRVFHNRSGLGNYSRNLVRALARFYPGNEYFLYNPKKGPVSFGSDLAPVSEHRPGFSNPLFVNLWRQRLLSDQAKNDGIDIFHGLSQELPAGLKKRNIPSVVTVHDLIFLRKPELYNLIDRKIYARKVRRACKQADVIVATSEQTRNDLHDLMGISPDRIKVIYQGCDPLFWTRRDPAEIQRVKEKYRLPEKYLLFVGTLEKRKNVKKIVKAAEKLQIPAVLVGKKTKYWQKESLSSPYLTTPVIEDNTELSALYQGAQLFVYPSYFEGFGIPVLEALVSGVPVITSNVSSLPEVAGPSALLINPAKQDELNEAIDRVWHSAELQKQMKESGYTFAQHFKDEVLAGQWQNLYKSLL